MDEARAVLRKSYQNADVGITGANFLVAETGSSIIVTNEGNGDLTQTLARVHVVLASIEKIVPTLDDAATILRLLARSATGQEFSAYTTLRPARAARPISMDWAISTGRSSTMSCWSITAARPCSAPSSRTCCAASAVRRA